VDDLLSRLTPVQVEGIRERILKGIAEVECGQFTEYVGRAGIRRLAADVGARVRERLRAHDIALE
jgi:hypothetical protein